MCAHSAKTKRSWSTVGAHQAEKPAQIEPVAKPGCIGSRDRAVVARTDNAPVQPVPRPDVAQPASRDGRTWLEAKVEPKTEVSVVPKLDAPKMQEAVAPPVVVAAPVVAAPIHHGQANGIDRRAPQQRWPETEPYASPTPMALFRRADVMWLVLDAEIAPRSRADQTRRRRVDRRCQRDETGAAGRQFAFASIARNWRR